MAPSGLFCMSGPVAHVDDDEDAPIDYVQMSKDVMCSQQAAVEDKTLPAISQEMKVYCCEKHSANNMVPMKQLRSEHKVKYLLSDGCLYEGEWGSDQQTGRGKVYWPSGSFYEGEVMDGNLHGTGTFTGADGTIYKGHWILNKKHGFGRKRYANGDVYEGFWKWDVPEGKGRYFWNNGSEYTGEWKGGLMCGRGVLSWASGDKYDGQWLNGLANGTGVYTWADGSSYVGTWSKGLKCGGGRFFQPVSKQVEIDTTPESLSDLRGSEDELLASLPSPRQSVTSPDVLQELKRLALSEKLSDLSMKEDQEMSDTMWRLNGFTNSISKLANLNGSLPESKESNLQQESDAVLIPITDSSSVKHNWLMKERRRPGETISKGHKSYELMLSLQHGVRFSVGKISPELNRKLFPIDFGPKARLKVALNRDGSQFNSSQQSSDFKWKDYCPIVFRHLRELFKVDAADFMHSICRSDGLREFSSPGKSGSVFYLSQDEQFLIKMLRKSEVKVLLGMLPRYYHHVCMYKNTLLTKFLGLYRIKPAGGQKVRFVVMGNVVSSDSWIHRRFDLKGSSQGRSADRVEADEITTLKDLDLEYVFYLDSSLRDAVLEQISRDCNFLESERIMDYSLLLGLHFKTPRLSKSFSQRLCPKVDLPLHEVVVSRFVTNKAGFVEVEVTSRPPASELPVNNRDKKILGRQSSLRLASGEDLSLIQDIESCLQLGANMPARACRHQYNDDGHREEVWDVALYCGIIDILQEYDMGKRLEHAYKSIQYDCYSISAVDPSQYSRRFQQFMHQIFPEKT